MLIEEIMMEFQTMARGLSNSATPICGLGDSGRHLTIDTACLQVSNIDAVSELELWGQSKECYTCLPWKYLTLAANSTKTLVVNSTYPMDMYVRDQNGSNVHRLMYHFGQYGDYNLSFNAGDEVKVKMLAPPHLEILPIVMTIVYFTMFTFMWQCGKFLMRRMDSSHIPPPTVTTERSPLLVSTANVSNQRVLDQQPGPSSSVPGPLHTSSSDSSSNAQAQGIHVHERVPDSKRAGGRLVSLDVFRGTAIIIMIFVNYGGGKYYFFKHARWNGLTVADLVFPWFLWIMGVSLAFSIRSQLRRATKKYIILMKILKRCIILFALGIVINSYKNNNVNTLRILGVLQRFAFCYLVNAALEVYCMAPQQSPEYVWYWKIRDILRSWLQWFVTIVLVCVHTLITFGLKVPGCPTGYLGPGGLHDGGAHSNCTGGAAGYVDQVVLGKAHIYQHPTCAIIYDSHTPYDPEGILGLLTSILMVQFGVAAGRIIITHKSHAARLIRWLVWGTVCGIAAGFLCSWQKEGGLIPVNKNLWSLSYVLTMNCFAFFLLCLFYLVIDKLGWWSGNPVRYVGMNPLVLYVGHETFGTTLPWSWSPIGHYHVNFLIMNVWGTCLWVVTAYVLHRKKIYISV